MSSSTPTNLDETVEQSPSPTQHFYSTGAESVLFSSSLAHNDLMSALEGIIILAFFDVISVACEHG